MKRKVLITSRSFGQVSNEPNNILINNGFEIDYNNNPFDKQRFEDEIQNYDALIIGAHEFTKEQMENAKKIKIIAKHGTGLDNIDLKAAQKMGIKVTNAPNTNSDAVADLAIGLMLDVSRKISYGAGEVKKGKWKRIIGVDVCNKTLGLIGFGAIAKNVAKRANGFGMKIKAYDPFIKEVPDDLNVELVTFEEVIKNSDIISIHVPLNDKTKDLISEKEMSKMKKGSFIINTSRGGIVNEKDLYEYLKEGHLAGSGLDVVEKEPPTGNPLLKLDNVTIVPHIGMYSKEAINAVSMICANNVVNCFSK